jgi:transcriptional regulator with PAS, ATPase and Fis domain
MLKYLPTESSYLPALYRQQDDKGNGSSGLNERELLYKVLFDMRKDVNDLKNLVHGLISEGVIDRSVMEKHSSLFDPEDDGDGLPEEYKPQAYVINKPQGKPMSTYNLDKIEDITHETERDESLSLQEKEKEMIIKALRKNNNKRKYAASDLGISERTLYRKIKQYEIDE